ncbi:MAG: hypothetical protein KDA32_03910 [Phycisphaerales bacterium]|nr:hypothetical protein [Phycisphaerales bacterium]
MRYGLLCVTLFLQFGPAARVALAQNWPPYELRVGDQLVYELRSRTTGAANPDADVAQLQFWVMGWANDEWKLLVDYTPVENGVPGATRGGFVYVGPRGALRLDEETHADLMAFDRFLRMFVSTPKSWEDQTNWTTPPDWQGRRLRCEADAPDAKQPGLRTLHFHVEDPTGVLEAMSAEHSGTITIDEQLGAPSSLQLVERNADGATTETVARFRRLLRNGEDFAARMEREAENWLRARRRFERLADEYERGVDDPEVGERRLRRCWPEFLQQAPRNTPFESFAIGAQMDIDGRVAALKRRRLLVTRWLGRTAPHWVAPDQQGASIRSESLPADKPIIEMFWTARSPASLAAFHMLRQADGETPNDSAATIVCVNVDGDISVGRAASAALAGDMMRVFTGAPITGLLPEDYPIFRVLTGDRRVKQLAFGLPANLQSLLEERRP